MPEPSVAVNLALRNMRGYCPSHFETPHVSSFDQSPSELPLMRVVASSHSVNLPEAHLPSILHPSFPVIINSFPKSAMPEESIDKMSILGGLGPPHDSIQATLETDSDVHPGCKNSRMMTRDPAPTEREVTLRSEVGTAWQAVNNGQYLSHPL